jgi:hypothetical protein
LVDGGLMGKSREIEKRREKLTGNDEKLKKLMEI